ncbi:GGDEF domain-containing protein [Leisingera aquaemixtae]|uniref:GGDEF domain-containing protein n=1 Tax=Leisingera aquaemixtae TaxID=1396826 RepID=A0ABY5WEZ8_9RHOB|nr:GGDEF domain-containing protein [Leisingera aquaemixtae]UWQ40041.1 GGDEF domain-containing protein [Leisingera aquaemixtae]
MAKLSAPVGGGKTAVNDPKDVVLVQKMLNEHAATVGYKRVPTNGKVGQPTILAIGQFQQQVVKTKVTSLVEPGSKTFKMLDSSPVKVAEQFAKAQGGRPLPAKGKVYEVKWRGKTHWFTEDDMGDAVDAIQSRLHTETLAFMSTLRNYQDQYREMQKGFWTFFVKMVTPNADIDRPAKSLKKADAAIGKLVDMTYGKNKKSLLASFKQMKQTKILLDAVALDLNMLSKELGQSAKICEEISVDLRDGAADIVQLILVTNGVNPATAGAVVAASKNTVQEIANGVILKGQWVKAGGVAGSFKRITFAAVAGGFSGWLGAKAGQMIMKGVGERLASRMVNSSWLSKYLWSTAARWGGKEIEIILGRFTAIPRKIGAEIALQTVLRMAHKFFTGRAIAKALTSYMTELEKIVSSCMEKSKAEGQLMDCIAAGLEKQGLMAKAAGDLLAPHKQALEREIEKALAKAEAKAG